MCCDEVDRVAWLSVALLVQVRTAADSSGKVALHVRVSLDEAPGYVAELSVPLRQARRTAAGELAHQVPIRPRAVPRLDDELHVLQERILHQPVDERRLVQDLAVIPAHQRSCEVEAEAIHAHFQRPVAQALADPLCTEGVIGVHRVAAAGVVGMVTVGHEVVMGFGNLRKGVPVALSPGTFPCVVEDHVEHDLNAMAVQLPHHGLELQGSTGSPALGVRCKALHGREEGRSGIAPVIAEWLFGQRVNPRARGFVELENRQKLHTVHTQTQ
mmetsp:Transcript_89384/g.208087  ORF Transcript_89384/g.208087 Transcript_89384/m.208087 type:complete len:271 (-) Transcript_89384:664-1476(-)